MNGENVSGICIITGRNIVSNTKNPKCYNLFRNPVLFGLYCGELYECHKVKDRKY